MPPLADLPCSRTPSWSSRCVALPILAAIIVLAALATGGVARAATLPPQGLYEECAPSSGAKCAGELSEMGAAGFRLALNYSGWYGHASDITTYANTAAENGIKVIWPLDLPAWRDPATATSLTGTFSDLARDCGCITNLDFMRYAINLVRSLPATWGYYIGDELGAADAPAVQALAAAVKALDPGHPLLYVGQGPHADTQIAPFANIPDVVGADVYPIGEGGDPTWVTPVASSIAQIAALAGRQSAMVLQAFSWTQYPNEVQATDPHWPTEAEMQQMRNAALAANPSMILWYNLADINRSDDPLGHFNALVSAAFAPAPGADATPVASIASASAGRCSARHAVVRRRHRRPRLHHTRRRHRRRHRARVACSSRP